jgi:hypothetical protein
MDAASLMIAFCSFLGFCVALCTRICSAARKIGVSTALPLPKCIAEVVALLYKLFIFDLHIEFFGFNSIISQARRGKMSQSNGKIWKLKTKNHSEA